jgi:cysteine desulfurase
MTNSIYLDNAASTPVAPEVLARMTEVMGSAWGNPSAAHSFGAAARRVIEGACQQVLAALGDPGELGDVLWTSGCTEADALALLGAAATGPGDLVLSTIEHPAVAQNAARLAEAGRQVIWVEPGRDGRVDPEQLAARCEGARVASVVAVQNEVGVIQPVEAIAAAVKARAPGCLVHIDAAQALGKVRFDVSRMAVDTVAIAAHKFHGPLGVGALWVRRGVELGPLWGGGGQQRGLRAGTQNAPGAAGLGVAAELATARRAAMTETWLTMAARVREILAAHGAAPSWQVDDAIRAPHILSLGFRRVTAEAVRNTLNSRGVAVSTGSACATSQGGGAAHGSVALAAMGVGQDVAMVRLSFGHQTTLAEVERGATALATVVRELAA